MGLFTSPSEAHRKGMVLFNKGEYRKAFPLLRKAAQAGIPEAQLYYGSFYLVGHGNVVDKDEKTAVEWYRKAAEQKYAPAIDALSELGIQEYADDSCRREKEEKDKEELRSRLENIKKELFLTQPKDSHVISACESGSSIRDQYAKAEQFYKDKNYAKALPLYENLAQKSHIHEVGFRLGELYEQGLGTAADPRKALGYYRKARDWGSVNAAFRLGELYFDGKLTPKDDISAVYVYLTAARRGHKEAAYRIATLCYYGTEVLPADYKAAYLWFSKIEGYKDSSLFKIRMELLGQGTKADASSLSVLTERAQAGDLAAACDLALLYFELLPKAQQNLYCARYWIQKAIEAPASGKATELAARIEAAYKAAKDDASDPGIRTAVAAEAGNAEAQYQLGILCEETLRDKKTAALWLEKAAKADYPPACFRLGLLLQDNPGYIPETIGWLNKAAQYGYEPAYIPLIRFLHNHFSEDNPELGIRRAKEAMEKGISAAKDWLVLLCIRADAEQGDFVSLCLAAYSYMGFEKQYQDVTDYKLADRFIRKAAEKELGYTPDSSFETAQIFASKKHTDPDMSAAYLMLTRCCLKQYAIWLEERAEGKDADAMFELFRFYYETNLSSLLEPDAHERKNIAYKWSLEAISHEQPDILYCASLTHYADFFNTDAEDRMEYARRADKAGHKDAYDVYMKYLHARDAAERAAYQERDRAIRQQMEDYSDRLDLLERNLNFLRNGEWQTNAQAYLSGEQSLSSFARESLIRGSMEDAYRSKLEK